MTTKENALREQGAGVEAKTVNSITPVSVLHDRV